MKDIADTKPRDDQLTCRKSEAESEIVSSGAKKSQLRCDICDVSISGMEAFQQHCAGRRHLNKLQAQAKMLLEKGAADVEETDAAGSCTEPADPPHASSSSSALQDMKKAGGNPSKKATSAAAPTNVSYVGENASLGEYCKQVFPECGRPPPPPSHGYYSIFPFSRYQARAIQVSTYIWR